MKRRRIGPTQSPVVSTTLNRRHTEARAASALRWGTVCVLFTLPLLLDMYVDEAHTGKSLNLRDMFVLEQVSSCPELLQRSQTRSCMVHRLVPNYHRGTVCFTLYYPPPRGVCCGGIGAKWTL